jgi:glycogen synthase
MNILLLTNEFPPHIYGGAGVHVDHLCREIRRGENGGHRLQVLCFGDQCQDSEGFSVSGVAAHPAPRAADPLHGKLMDVLNRNIVMAARVKGADIVHCHTWYAYLAGCLLKQLLEAPLVVTVHSLEPLRPWKREQLGNGYNVSEWLEKTALSNADGIIAVSGSMRQDIQALYGVNGSRVRVIPNGIDLDRFRRTRSPEVLAAYGIDPARPYVLFVGRVSRQKGIIHLVRAIPRMEDGIQVVLCAGMPDTGGIAEEMRAAVEAARGRTRNPVIWVPEMVPEERLIALYSQAALFICPSIYEPFGIINLEAMACGTPVVGAAVGGIAEVVVDGETGVLVPFEPAGGGNPEPRDPDGFSADLAAAVNALVRAPERRAQMGRAARARVERHFSWESVARRTIAYYEELARR